VGSAIKVKTLLAFQGFSHNKQTNKQTNKQANKQTNKQTI
jgi:hypothetical protein